MKLIYTENNYEDMLIEHFQALLNAHKEPDTVVDVRQLEGPYKTACPRGPFTPPLPYYYGDLFHIIKKAEEEGYDGVMIGCSADPGLRTARYMTKIPIFAPLKSALHLAGLLGRGQRVTAFKPSHDGKWLRPKSWQEGNVLSYGFRPEVVTIKPVLVEGLGQQELYNNYVVQDRWDELREKMLSAFRRSVVEDGIKQAKKAVSEDEADVLYFGCTLWGGMLSPVAQAVEVPVLDPVISMLKVAEMSIKSMV